MARSSSPMKSPVRPSRPRMNSKDIPRTYSGLYGDESDLLPFELSRNRNTDWMAGGWWLLCTYVGIILVGELVFMAFLPFTISWTAAHVTHFVVTLVYLHWIKGSPNFYEQGEMNAMTLWEQLESKPCGDGGVKRVLMIVPTLTCYAACHFSLYDAKLCILNSILWIICMLAKMPFMNGVRILGINRTTGIDDDGDIRCKRE